jgi:hypothetical protein
MLYIPALAFAEGHRGLDGHQERPWGYGDEFRCHDHDTHGDRDRGIATVPDGGPGILLLAAAVGTILIFSRRKTCRA